MIANTVEEISIFKGTEPLRVLIVVHSHGDSERPRQPSRLTSRSVTRMRSKENVCRIGTVDSE